MKTLFFIAALAGAIYLIMQTPAGKAWSQESQSEISSQQEVEKTEPVSIQVVHLLESKMAELTQHLSHQQQTKISQLETRIAELENEFIMSRVAKQQQTAADSKVTLHPYQESQTQRFEQPLQQMTASAPPPNTQAKISNGTLQRKRQAKLQDIVQKMEMSSLQALVN